MHWKRSDQKSQINLISLNESITWSKHVEEISKNITAEINALKWLRVQMYLFQFIMH